MHFTLANPRGGVLSTTAEKPFLERLSEVMCKCPLSGTIINPCVH